MEEMVQELREQGVLVRRRRGSYAPVRHLPTICIFPPPCKACWPPASTASRQTRKTLLQQLAVIGREFPLSLVRQVVAQPEDELYRLLCLAPAQRVSLRTARVSRGRVHLQACADAGSGLRLGAAGAAQSLARAHGAGDRSALPAPSLDEHYSELAHHYSRSGNTQKAVEYLHLAGQQAVQRSANAEAITHLTTALELLKTLPDTPRARPARTHAATRSGRCRCMATKGFAAPEVEARLHPRAGAVPAGRGDPPALPGALWAVDVLSCAGRVARRRVSWGSSSSAWPSRTQDPAFLLEAHRALGSTLF